MITYDRSIRTLLHSTLRRICGPIGGARCRAGIDAPLHIDDPAALACIGSGRRQRNPAPASRKRRIAALAAAVIVLGALIAPSRPAQAQDDANPPISATASATLYLPAVARQFPQWFTDAELEQAQRDAGYDVDEAGMHTNCVLDVTAVPPYLMRYTSCSQYFIHGVGPTEGTGRYILWQKLADGIVHGTEVQE